jgi:surfeit locus 1 family protein
MMLALTLWLGVWQIERLHWKEHLLADIDRAEAAPPIPLPTAPIPFEKVEVSGHLRDDLAAHYGSEVRSTVDGPKLGAQLIVPLERPGEVPILVDRGWYPDGLAPPADPASVTITGYIRPPEPAGPFAPNPDLTERR